jgi:hypothetical protein
MLRLTIVLRTQGTRTDLSVDIAPVSGYIYHDLDVVLDAKTSRGAVPCSDYSRRREKGQSAFRRIALEGRLSHPFVPTSHPRPCPFRPLRDPNPHHGKGSREVGGTGDSPGPGDAIGVGDVTCAGACAARHVGRAQLVRF